MGPPILLSSGMNPHMSSRLASTSSSPLCGSGDRSKRSFPATHSHRSSSRHVLKPGPLGLGKDGSIEGESSALSGLRRQQFRQKCQEAMARDRLRDRGRKIAKSRESNNSVTETDSDQDSDEQSKTIMHSDDLSSSDLDDEQEAEMARRILAVDYRRMIREQERSGNVGIGWLDPDEVAWLEEEVKREEAQGRQTDLEPPEDLLDEDEELFAQYQHAQNTASTTNLDEEDSEEDFSWLDDEGWQRAIEGADTVMSDI